jgi:hypothetical protein
MRKSREVLLQQIGAGDDRALAVDVYRRLIKTPLDQSKGSLFATAFTSPDEAMKVYKDVVVQVEKIQPNVDELVLLPPLDFACAEDGLVKIDELLFLVLSSDHTAIVPVCSIGNASSELLDTIIELYTVKSSVPVTMRNVAELVLKNL